MSYSNDSLNGMSLRDELAEAIDLTNRSFTDKDSLESMNRKIADACLAVMAGRWGIPLNAINRVAYEGLSFDDNATYITLAIPAPTTKA